jgi:hypothetical protein
MHRRNLVKLLPTQTNVTVKIHHPVLLGSTVTRLSIHVNWYFPVASSVQGKTSRCWDLVVEVKDILGYFMQIDAELFVFMLNGRRVNWGEK